MLFQGLYKFPNHNLHDGGKDIEKLPKFGIAVNSIYKELGNSFNKHATVTNLANHAGLILCGNCAIRQ